MTNTLPHVSPWRRLLASLLIIGFAASCAGALAFAQTRDSTYAVTHPHLVFQDSEVILFRIVTHDTTVQVGRPVPPPPVDTFPRPLPIGVTDPLTLSSACQTRVLKLRTWYNAAGAVPDPCVGQYPPRVTPPPPIDSTPADTTPPPPPPPGGSGKPATCLNEPINFRTLNNQPFDTYPSVGWKDRDAASARQISVANGVATYTFPAGSHGGASPGSHHVNFTLVQDLYQCVIVQGDANWTDNGNAGTKWTFVDSPARRNKTAFGNINHYLNWSKQLDFNLQSTGARLNRNIHSNVGITKSPTPRTVEVLIRSGTAGVANGQVLEWVDGVQKMNATDVKLFDTGMPTGFDGVIWEMTYGGGLNPVPMPLAVRIYHWYISGR